MQPRNVGVDKLDPVGKLVLMYLENGVQLVGKLEGVGEEEVVLAETIEVRELMTDKGPILSGRVLGDLISGDLKSTLVILSAKSEHRALYSQIISNIQLLK